MICYEITCLPTGKRYIGITSRTSAIRWRIHVKDALNGHSQCMLIARAILKYGAPQFVVRDLASARDYDDLKAVERVLIAQEGTQVPRGLNVTLGGEGVMYGRSHSMESKEKMSRARAGQKMSKAQCDAQAVAFIGEGNPFFGKRHSPESIEKMKQAKVGNSFRKGHTHSDAAREKMSAALRGERHPQFGKPLPASVREKISSGRRGAANPMSKESQARRALEGR